MPSISRILGEQAGDHLLGLGRVPVGVDRLAAEQFDLGIVGEDLLDALQFGLALQVARRAAEEHHLALAAELVGDPLRPARPVIGRVRSDEVDIVLARRAARRGGIGDDRGAGLEGLADGRQHGRTGVGEDDDRLDPLGDEALEVGDGLLRVVLAVDVDDFVDVGALGGLVLELGAGDAPPRVAAEAVDQRHPDRLVAANLVDRSPARSTSPTRPTDEIRSSAWPAAETPARNARRQAATPPTFGTRSSRYSFMRFLPLSLHRLARRPGDGVGSRSNCDCRRRLSRDFLDRHSDRRSRSLAWLPPSALASWPPFWPDSALILLTRSMAQYSVSGKWNSGAQGDGAPHARRTDGACGKSGRRCNRRSARRGGQP